MQRPEFLTLSPSLLLVFVRILNVLPASPNCSVSTSPKENSVDTNESHSPWREPWLQNEPVYVDKTIFIKCTVCKELLLKQELLKALMAVYKVDEIYAGYEIDSLERFRVCTWKFPILSLSEKKSKLGIGFHFLKIMWGFFIALFISSQ